MALHGWVKWQEGSDGFLSGQWLGSLGVPQPEILAWVVVVTELVGGILIVLGLFSRIFGIGTVILLAVALARVKGFDFLITPAEGEGLSVWAGEIDWALLFAAVALALVGPGRLSLDYLLGIERR